MVYWPVMLDSRESRESEGGISIRGGAGELGAWVALDDALVSNELAVLYDVREGLDAIDGGALESDTGRDWG